MITTLVMVICLGSDGSDCNDSQEWAVRSWEGPSAVRLCDSVAQVKNLEEKENPHAFARKWYCDTQPVGE